MKTQWGSCNPDARRVWSNLVPAKKHPPCLEYMVVQERVHFLERTHGGRVTKLMDAFLPDWRSRRDELNGAPLAHYEWSGDGDLRAGAAS